MNMKALLVSLIKGGGASLIKSGPAGTLAKNFRPPWKAKSMWIALAMVVLGGGLYLKDPGNSGTVAKETRTVTATDQATPSSADAHFPAPFRLGVSYMGGFLIGWGFRRFIRLSVSVSLAALAVVTLGRNLGWIDLDWTMLEGQVRQTTAWIQGEAGTFKDFLESYLPSAGTAGVGAFLGFRRK